MQSLRPSWPALHLPLQVITGTSYLRTSAKTREWGEPRVRGSRLRS